MGYIAETYINNVRNHSYNRNKSNVKNSAEVNQPDNICVSFGGNKENESSEINNKPIVDTKALPLTLDGLASAGIALSAVSKRNDSADTECGKRIVYDTSAVFKDGIAYDVNGGIYTGIPTKNGTNGEKYTIEIKDGIIQQSEKTSKDGKTEWVKKYYQDKYKNRIVDILHPDENGDLKIENRIISSKDKIALFQNENTVDQYWFKTPEGFKRVDEFTDKSDIKDYRSPEFYCLYNGIQNSFLRDGVFSNPDIRCTDIPYEILKDPDASQYEKEKVKEIMRDNRFILSVIDDLDCLTQTSVAEKPMTGYRNAPKWWVNKAQDGILTEDAFCSASVEKGASMEGLYLGKYAKDGVTYTIHVPKGATFFDLTNTSEKEMLFPRKGKFKVLGDTELEYIV